MRRHSIPPRFLGSSAPQPSVMVSPTQHLPDLVDVERLGAFKVPSAFEADSTVPVVFSRPAWAVKGEVFAP